MTPKADYKIQQDDSVLSILKVWTNSFPSKAIFVNRGKKSKHSLQLIVALALRGPNTTREIAKYVIEQSPKYQYQRPKDKD